MVRHPTARRTRHQQPETEDAFVERVLETSLWARQNKRILVVGGIALVLIIAGLLWYRGNRAATRERAVAELAQVRQTLFSGNTALAVQDLQRYLNVYGGEAVADEARLLLGESHLRRDDPAAAIEVLARLARDLEHPLGAQAAFLTASAYEASDQPDQAEPIYLRIADGAPFEYQQLRALDAAARLRAAAANHAGAAELYDRAVNLLEEGDPQRSIFQMRLAEARAAAGPAATTAGS